MANYLGLVKETLVKDWARFESPLLLREEDFTAGVALFTKIALEAIQKDDAPKKADFVASEESDAEPTPVLETSDKIKAFVEKKSYYFRRACQTGFPFSLIESPMTEVALKQFIKRFDSMIACFLMAEDHWMGEEELNERFSGPFERLEASEVAEACVYLTQAYARQKDNRAGFYFLWLLKQAAGCHYDIPEAADFNHETVSKVLNQFIKNDGSLKISSKFVEILLGRGSRLDAFIYQQFLDAEALPIFLNFAVNVLNWVPMHRWKGKGGAITDLLETLSPRSKESLATMLISSDDHETRIVGEHLHAALTATSLTQAIPHFYALKEQIKGFNESHIQIIFGRPFEDFCHDRSIFKTDPNCTKRLHFNGKRRVYVQGTLMMGVFEPRTTFNGKGVPPHLLAYDMITEKMVWGLSLSPEVLDNPALYPSGGSMTYGLPRMGPAEYALDRVGQFISLQFKGDKKVSLYNPITGELDSTIETPEASKDPYDELHISSAGIAYQMIKKKGNRTLIGGKIVDNQWNKTFEVETPGGFFKAYSTHCGFENFVRKTLILMGPTGDQVAFNDCLNAMGHEDKFYTIEKDPEHKGQCLLNVRTLKFNQEVVSEVEKTIPLNTSHAKFGKFCENGQLILLNGNNSETSPIFIDFERGEVTYSDHKVPSYGELFINAQTAELWSWDQIKQKIWKVSSSDVQEMGTLNSGRGTSLLHVDDVDCLYFVDIPY